MRYVRILPALAVAAIFVGSAVAQDEKSSHAGHVDIDWSKAVGDQQPSVQVMLDRPLLKMVASASKQSDADLNALIAQLAFVRVSVYEDLKAEAGKVVETVDGAVAALSSKGWSTVAKVREGEDRVDVLMKSSGENIVGFVVIVSESTELVFVNIAGDIDPEEFGAKLGTVITKFSGGEFDIEELTGIFQSLKGSAAGQAESSGEAKDD